jgi:hypothetical protein
LGGPVLKSPFIVALYRKHTRALTFENLCQDLEALQQSVEEEEEEEEAPDNLDDKLNLQTRGLGVGGSRLGEPLSGGSLAGAWTKRYTYIYMYICVCVYIYSSACTYTIHKHVHIHIYLYIYRCVESGRRPWVKNSGPGGGGEGGKGAGRDVRARAGRRA